MKAVAFLQSVRGLLVLFLNRGPKSLSMWGVEVGIYSRAVKR